MKKIVMAGVALLLLAAAACVNNPQEKKNKVVNEDTTTMKPEIETENLSYPIEGKEYKSYLAYDKNAKGKLPVVMIFPEWWGITDYVKNRAKQIAELGYVAMVVDFYGEATIATNPEEAQKLSKPFYGGAEPAKAIFGAALKAVINQSNADGTRMAIIGYCFGGAMALNMARVGEPLKGVVSFHGNLLSGVKAESNKVPMLVLNGADDSFVSDEDIASFRAEMDSAQVQYSFISYPGAVHAFTNPEATAIGKKFDMNVAYNVEADKESWEEMKKFLAQCLSHED